MSESEAVWWANYLECSILDLEPVLGFSIRKEDWATIVAKTIRKWWRRVI